MNENGSVQAAQNVHLRCSQCREQFNDEMNLQKHQLLHNSNSINAVISFTICTECGQAFYQSAYENHLKLHDVGELVVCKLCEKPFVSNCELTKHIQTDHDNGTSSDINSIPNSTLHPLTPKHITKMSVTADASNKFQLFPLLASNPDVATSDSDDEEEQEAVSDEEPLQQSVSGHELPIANMSSCFTRSRWKGPQTESFGIGIALRNYLIPGSKKALLIFKCIYCWKLFKNGELWLHHMKGHKDPNATDNAESYWYKCVNCEEKFQNKEKLQQHLKHHPLAPHDNAPWKKSLIELRRVREKRIASRQKSCVRRRLIEYVVDRTGNVCQYECQQCFKWYSLPSGLICHRASEHSINKNFVCNECGSSFGLLQQLKKHKKLHLSNKPFQETKQGKRLNRLQATIDGLVAGDAQDVEDRSKSTVDLIAVVAPENSLNTADHLNRLEASIDDVASSEERHPVSSSADLGDTADGGKQFSCDECDKKFEQKARLTHHLTSATHKITVLQKNISKSENPDEPYRCKDCSKTFNSLRAWKRHIVEVHIGKKRKKFSCDECGAKFGGKYSLAHHKTCGTHRLQTKNHLNATNVMLRLHKNLL